MANIITKNKPKKPKQKGAGAAPGTAARASSSGAAGKAAGKAKCLQQSGTSTANPDDPLFFFKPDEEHGEFRQWYPAKFTVSKAEISALVGHPIDEADPEGWGLVSFKCAEQFMMYCKAGRFHDIDTQQLVMATRDPKEQKRLARLTKGFKDASWDEIKSRVVVMGNMAKFGQNTQLKTLLLETGSRPLVEAASHDRVWGIGYTAKTAMLHRETWGENRLGKSLMEVREKLREEESRKEDDADSNGG